MSSTAPVSKISKRMFDKVNGCHDETMENKKSCVEVCKTRRSAEVAAYLHGKYEEAVESFNKAKEWLDEIVACNDDNPFTVVPRYTDPDFNSEDEFVLEVVDKMNLMPSDFMELKTHEIDQMIKDIEDGKHKMYEFMECRETITKLKKMPKDDDDIHHKDGWVDSSQYDQNSFGDF